jgi:alginate O-acetyltransferase complex protein AlgJ
MSELQKPSRIRARAQLLLNVSFCLVLFGMLGISVLTHSEQETGPRGERLAPLPRFQANLASLARFLPAYRDYFVDHFAFRERLIHWHGRMELQAFGLSCSPLAVAGKRGYFFSGHSSFTEIYRGERPFTETQLIRWQRLLEERDEWLRSRGAHYALALVPVKQSIYPELLPARLRVTGAVSRTDQLVQWMRQHSPVRVLDLRDAVRRAKGDGDLYLKTDSHWTDLGAYAGYQELINRLRDWYPSLSPQPRQQFRRETVTLKGGDLARFMGLRFMLNDEAIDLRPVPSRRARDDQGREIRSESLLQPGSTAVFHCPGAPIARAVVVHDSFAWRLAPFLAEHFGRGVFHWSYPLDRGLLEREHPDLVLQEMVENELMDDRHAYGR